MDLVPETAEIDSELAATGASVEDAHVSDAAHAPEPAQPQLKSPTVGVFDSGVGGFTVASAVLKLRPDLNLVYYADSLNLPYGGREQEQLERFAGNIIEFLLAQGIDILADGCNTSAGALHGGAVRGYHIPVFDLVSSTVEALREKRLPDSIAILATEATIRAGFWEKSLADAFPGLPLHPMAAPELVPLIESATGDDGALHFAVGKHVRLIREAGAEAVLLGCTHYPLLQKQLLDADVYLRLIDPGQCLAEKLTESLANPPGDAPPGTLRFYNSRPSERFYQLGERIFGRPIRELTKMYIVNAYED